MTYTSMPQMWVYPPMLLTDISGGTSVCAGVPTTIPASAILAASMPSWYSEPNSLHASQTPLSSPNSVALPLSMPSMDKATVSPQGVSENVLPAPTTRRPGRKRRPRKKHNRCAAQATVEKSTSASQSIPAGFWGAVEPGQEEQQHEEDRQSSSCIRETLDANKLKGNQELCAQVIKQLSSVVDCERHATVKSLVPSTRLLAFDKAGSRVVQEAIAVGSVDERDQLVGQLKGCVNQLWNSPSANYVLSKIIEVMPSAKLGLLREELSGNVCEAARHQYGCRMLERLLEHWGEHEVNWIVNEVLPNAEELCRHRFGNFVMQHMFEHGPRDCKAKIADRIIGFLPKLAKHRIASHVIQKALLFSDEDTQYRLVQTFLLAQHDDSIVDVACARYGIYVLEELATVQVCISEVRQRLLAELQRLQESQYGHRAVTKFSLEAWAGEVAVANSASFL